MKNLVTILLVLVTVFASAQTELDSILISNINDLRANPKSFIPHIERYIFFQEKDLERIKSGKMVVRSTSGGMTKNNDMSNKTIISNDNVIKRNIEAANELIEELNNTDSLSPLTFNKGMDSITDNHGKYLESIKKHGHYGPNGQSVSDRFKVSGVSENIIGISKYSLDNKNFTPALVAFLVDSGIENRGHRKNLLNPNSTDISVYISKFVCVLNFI